MDRKDEMWTSMAKKLDTGHQRTCAWAGNPSPSTFCRLPALPRDVTSRVSANKASFHSNRQLDSNVFGDAEPTVDMGSTLVTKSNLEAWGSQSDEEICNAIGNISSHLHRATCRDLLAIADPASGTVVLRDVATLLKLDTGAVSSSDNTETVIMLLSLFGWALKASSKGFGSDPAQKSLVCSACGCHLSLSMFCETASTSDVAVGERENKKRKRSDTLPPRRFDVLNCHHWYCPFRQALGKTRAGTDGSVDPSGPPGWWRFVLSWLHMQNRQTQHIKEIDPSRVLLLAQSL